MAKRVKDESTEDSMDFNVQELIDNARAAAPAPAPFIPAPFIPALNLSGFKGTPNYSRYRKPFAPPDYRQSWKRRMAVRRGGGAPCATALPGDPRCKKVRLIGSRKQVMNGSAVVTHNGEGQHHLAKKQVGVDKVTGRAKYRIINIKKSNAMKARYARDPRLQANLAKGRQMLGI